MPFQELRAWARRASVGERAGSAVLAAVVVAVLAWLLVPAHPGSNGSVAAGSTGAPGSAAGTPAGTGRASVSGAGGPAAGSAGSPTAGSLPGAPGAGAVSSGAAGGGTGTGSGGGSAAGGAVGGAAAPGGGCVSPPGGDQGVTSTTIRVAVTLVNIVGPAGNATFGLPPASEQQSDYQDVVDSINASGGVACRKLVPLFFEGNPADQSNLQQLCLDIAQAGVFFEVDSGAYYTSPAIADCYPAHGIPFLSNAQLPAQQEAQFYPYLYGKGTLDVLYRNSVRALHDRGFFSAAKGFRKLGFVYRDCIPQLVSEFTGLLRQAGVAAADIVTYDVGCPSGFATPSDLEQAVLKFESAGVTNVTQVQFYADFSNFTTVAEQQGFRPRYGLPDDGIAGISYGTQHPDYNNIANAVDITADRYGEERTPGLSPSAGTARCDAVYRPHGQVPVYQQGYGFGGLACDELWIVQAAADHATTLKRSALAAGLQAARSVDLSYPWGPNDFSGSRVTSGDEFWRTDQFFTSCSCWRVVDPTFHPSAG